MTSSILAEISALKVPSILIPSPYVTENHQYKNAMDLVNNNAADIIEEKDLTLTNFINTFNTLITEKELYQERMNNYQNNYQIDKMINEVLNE